MTGSRMSFRLLPLLLAVILLSCGPSKVGQQEEEVREIFTPTAGQPEWVDTLMASLTLEEKVGQLIMARAFGHYISTDSDEFLRLRRLVQDVKVGGLILFQADVYAQAVLLNKLQGMARVPLLVAGDYERGLAMRVRRATYFPDAMAIGATRNPHYAFMVGEVTAREGRAVGVHQNFAPVTDVNNNPDNPVINTRSFGEDRDLVATMAGAFIQGLHRGGMVSTTKHFPGHGDTGVDSHIDLPVLPFSRERLDSIELSGFKKAVHGGVMSVMMAHLAAPALDSSPGMPASLSYSTITTLLRGELGFHGLVVTDAMDMAGLMKGFSTGQAAVLAIKAGADILLMPTDEQVALDAVVGAVRRGEIPQERIDESVRRVLAAKKWLRLDEDRLVNIDSIALKVATKDHRRLAKDIARNAITVLKNDRILPLQQYGRKRVVSVIVSDTEDNRTEVHRPGYQYANEPVGAYFSQQFRRRYGSVETHRLTPGSSAPVLDSVLNRVRRADIVMMPLYVKVRSGSGRIGLPQNMASFFSRVADLQKPTIVISFGNPYVVGAFPLARAILCAYSDAEVLVEATVEALFGEIDVRGKLPVTIPGQFAYGSGVQYGKTELRADDPAYVGFDQEKLQMVDDVVMSAIRDSAFPGAQVAVIKDGILAYNKSFGTYTYDADEKQITASTLFDLASLTKVVSTTSAVMKLYDLKRLSLDDAVGRFIPGFEGGSRSRVTIRHLLSHTSGLPAYRRLWQIAATPDAALDSVFNTALVASPGDTVIYSDLNMIIMGKIVERLAGLSLAEFVKHEFFDPLGMTSTMFVPPGDLYRQCAPTELDTAWRKVLLRGSVHDENAAFLGGVSGHAGLFSTASDLAIFMQMLLNKGTYAGVRYLEESTVQEFTRRPSAGAKRALGWDLKSAEGSSAGSRYSPSSFGHTGFTGTSIWVDPERNLCTIFLTNRVFPTRANQKIFKVRPALHDAVIGALILK